MKHLSKLSKPNFWTPSCTDTTTRCFSEVDCNRMRDCAAGISGPVFRNYGYQAHLRGHRDFGEGVSWRSISCRDPDGVGFYAEGSALSLSGERQTDCGHLRRAGLCRGVELPSYAISEFFKKKTGRPSPSIRNFCPAAFFDLREKSLRNIGEPRAGKAL